LATSARQSLINTLPMPTAGRERLRDALRAAEPLRRWLRLASVEALSDQWGRDRLAEALSIQFFKNVIDTLKP
jgi:hypothetical protein